MKPATSDPFTLDASLFFGSVLRPDELAPVLLAIREQPDSELAWVRLTGWLNDNGHYDEAEAVRAFWPAILDSISMGMPLGRALGLLSRNAVGLARLARRVGE